MLLIAFAAYLLVCYLIAGLFFRKQTDDKLRLRNSLITTLFLAVFGIAGLVYWDYSSKRCQACDEPIDISQLTGTWKTRSKLIQINEDSTFESEYLSSPSLKSNGMLTIDGSLLKFQDAETERGNVTFEVCQIKEDKILYHDFSRRMGDNDLKSEAVRVK